MRAACFGRFQGPSFKLLQFDLGFCLVFQNVKVSGGKLEVLARRRYQVRLRCFNGDDKSVVSVPKFKTLVPVYVGICVQDEGLLRKVARARWLLVVSAASFRAAVMC